MPNDVAQDSRTRLQDASGHDNNLGFSVSTAGHRHKPRPATPPTQPRYARTKTTGWSARSHRLRPRIAADLVTTGLHLLDPDTRPGPVDPGTKVDWEEANAAAGFITAVANAARCAATARTPTGEIAGWRRVIDLPGPTDQAADELEYWADRLAADVAEQRRCLDPAVRALTCDQPSPTSWSLPVPDTATRGVWAGSAHWQLLAAAAVDAARATVTVDCSPANVRALIAALAASFDASGRGCTAATRTIVARAVDRFGATCAVSTGCRRLRTITRILIDADLLIVHARGRWLRSIERIAARLHHGGRQHRAANVVDANVPAHLRPTTSHSPTAPAYATGLAARLATRDAQAAGGRVVDNPAGTPTETKGLTCDNEQPSTYTCGSGFSSSHGCSWGAHARVSAHEGTDFSSETGGGSSTRGRISVRAWRICDDLTRDGVDHGLDAGPYRHLIGSGAGRMSRLAVARLIDQLTPPTAGTRQVMAGLVHAATSTTGFVALGLSTRPTNATGWLARVLSRIDWDAVDEFPAWSKVAEAYGVHWCGPRRGWTPIG